MSTAFAFGRRSRDTLKGVHPDLILVVSRGLLYSSYDFAISEGLRSIERQRELVSRRLSMTYASKHLVQPSGYAHAIDVVATGDLNADGTVDAQDKALVWDQGVYSMIAGAMRRAADELKIGIRWGGEFKSFFDGPHFELVDA